MTSWVSTTALPPCDSHCAPRVETPLHMAASNGLDGVVKVPLTLTLTLTQSLPVSLTLTLIT